MDSGKIYVGAKKLYDSHNYTNLKQMINISAEKFKDETAFLAMNKEGKNEKISYKEYSDDINALGTALISVGLKNKKIAVLSENRYEWALAYLSVVNGVGIIVPLDRALTENEIISSIDRAEVEAVFFSDKYLETMEKIQNSDNCKVKFFISMDLEEKNEKIYSQKELIRLGKDLISNGATSYTNSEIDEGTMSVMLFTSGTTSKSKVVMLSHRNICSNINSITEIFDVHVGDTLLSFLPLHHTYECTVGFLYPLSVGAKITYCRGIRYIAEDIKNNQVSVMISVPILFESLYKQVIKTVEKTGQTKKFNFGLKLSNFLRILGIDKRRKIFKSIHENLGGHLRLFVAGAAAFNPDIEKKLNDIGIDTYQGYGATEHSPVIAAEHKNCVNPGSVGMLIPGCEGKLVDVDEDGIGEFAIKSSSVMLGYYNNDEASKETLKDGWFYTGDLGYFDKNGYMFITGRKKNVIVLQNGKNVFPEEIELLINEIYGIKESFVYAKSEKQNPDDVKLACKVVYDEEIMKNEFNLEEEDDIKEKLWKDIKEVNKKMPTYKYVKSLIVTKEEFSKTTTQKIKRFEEIKKV